MRQIAGAVAEELSVIPKQGDVAMQGAEMDYKIRFSVDGFFSRSIQI